MNTFNYRPVSSMGRFLGFDWELVIDDMQYSGRASSIRKAYRKGRQTIRRHKKMQRLLGNE